MPGLAVLTSRRVGNGRWSGWVFPKFLAFASAGHFDEINSLLTNQLDFTVCDKDGT